MLLKPSFLIKNKSTILYGSSLAALLVLLKWLELKFLILSNAFEIYAGMIAAIFTGLGIWLALKLTKPKVETLVVERKVFVNKEETFIPDKAIIEQLNLSKRELDVLTLMAGGLSNQEIASRLFVSLNTVKTHTSNLFEKMDVKRRTQAVDAAKRLHIIA